MQKTMKVPVFCSYGTIKSVDNLVSSRLSPPWRYHFVNLSQYIASFHCYFDSVLSIVNAPAPVTYGQNGNKCGSSG